MNSTCACKVRLLKSKYARQFGNKVLDSLTLYFRCVTCDVASQRRWTSFHKHRNWNSRRGLALHLFQRLQLDFYTCLQRDTDEIAAFRPDISYIGKSIDNAFVEEKTKSELFIVAGSSA